MAGADAARERISQPAGREPDCGSILYSAGGERSRGDFRREGNDSQKPIIRTQKVLHRVLPILAPGLGGGCAGGLQGA